MGVTNENLQRAVNAARVRESQGYFVNVKKGDQRAASLFARLVAFDLNPTGKTSDYGWLTKQPGEQQVDGFSEDSIVFGASPSDLNNVVDLVAGAGAAGASIGGSVKERRPSNTWVQPHALTNEETNYLLSGGGPVPAPVPTFPSYEELGGDEGAKKITRQLESDYKRAGRSGLDGDSGAWLRRTDYDFMTGKVATVEESVTKHRPEWCAALGIPVE